MASHRNFFGQNKHLSGQIKFGQTNLLMEISLSLLKIMNVQTNFGPYHKHCAAVIRLLYTTLVQSILDYSSTIWNLDQMGNTRELEYVQRRATKLIPSLQGLPCFERYKISIYPVYPIAVIAWT